jgi:hypothetical protein
MVAVFDVIPFIAEINGLCTKEGNTLNIRVFEENEKPADLVDFIKIKNKNLNLPNDNCFAVLTFEIPSQSKKKILLELDNNFNINYENIIVKNEKINSIENAFNNLMKNIKNFF